MTARVKLCAIAKNEGAYLADWVFHHLYFGFDAIEVWVNGTDDPSLRILKRISKKHPEVTGRRADRLLAECLASGEVFQHRAYAGLARKARRQGYTHVAFLDLDEYWLPRDFGSSIKAFVPDDPDVNVVSFPWCVDVPDPARKPFSSPMAGQVQVQLDRHVKSVVRLDGSVRKFHAHTGLTRRGVRLLVREPFPMVDRRAQGHGSLVTEEFLVQHWADLPEALVLHAINRSQHEYVASLTKGLRQAGSDLALRVDRFGFVPTEAPVLSLSPKPRSLRAYRRQRKRFLRAIDADRLTRRSEELVTARADALLAELSTDSELMDQLRGPLRGVSAPTLDAEYPGWDARISWWVDSIEALGDRTVVVGWAFGVTHPVGLEFAMRDAEGMEWTDLAVTSVTRPEVREKHAEAPLDCGFEIEVPESLRADLENVLLLVRAPGSTPWEATRLARVAAPPTVGDGVAG